VGCGNKCLKQLYMHQIVSKAQCFTELAAGETTTVVHHKQVTFKEVANCKVRDERTPFKE